MRTLLLNPPSYHGFDGGAGSRYQARREIRSFWYPTWLAYPAAQIPHSKLLDAPANDLDAETVIRIAGSFDIVAMSTSTPTVSHDVKLAESIKERHPSVRIGLLGPHAMVEPEETLIRSRSLDFVTIGEFDYTIPEIAAGVPFQNVNGILYRSGDKLLRTPARPLNINLDHLPFVTPVYARDLTIENYFNGYLLHPYLSLYTGRGCRARCTYCLWPQTISGHDYRVRSVDNVYEEMVLAKRLLPQVKEYFFDDDTFTEDAARARAIARKIRHLGITWSCNARANVSFETLKVLKESGLRLLTVGFESGSQTILNNIKKGITIEGARKFMRAAKDLGILVHGAFILGLPGETPESIEQTMQYALELDPYSIQVSLLAPYPGTEVYAQGMKEGWIVREGSNLIKDGIQDAALSYKGLERGQIFEALERFYRRYYFRPRAVMRILKEMLQDRHMFSRRLREGREFFSFMARRKEAAL